jgi:hypothetical protein
VSGALLQERQQTHGSFEENARIAQRLRAFFRGQPAWESMPDVHKEALDNIALKFSRIFSGQADCSQHWEDVEGYAALARKACTR